MRAGSSYIVTSTATPTIVVGYNAERKGLVVSNGGTGPIYLAWAAQHGSAAGVRLDAGSAPLVLSRRLHAGLLDGPIWVSSAADQPVAIAEGLGD